jgi:PII-like signaling protein
MGNRQGPYGRGVIGFVRTAVKRPRRHETLREGVDAPVVVICVTSKAALSIAVMPSRSLLGDVASSLKNLRELHI